MLVLKLFQRHSIIYRNVDVQHINVLLGYVTKRVFDGDDVIIAQYLMGKRSVFANEKYLFIFTSLKDFTTGITMKIHRTALSTAL